MPIDIGVGLANIGDVLAKTGSQMAVQSMRDQAEKDKTQLAADLQLRNQQSQNEFTMSRDAATQKWQGEQYGLNRQSEEKRTQMTGEAQRDVARLGAESHERIEGSRREGAREV